MPYFPYNRYPYSNFHDLNLDWILETIQELYRRITSYEGSATPYESDPRMDGIANPGNVNQFARGDHCHPTDTTRASVVALEAVRDSVPGPSNGLPRMDGNAYSGFYDNYSRADHVHPSDTSKLDKTGGTVTGLLDILPRRCYASLSSSGWYRVLTVADHGRANRSWMADINITREFRNENNEVHSIKLMAVFDSFSFADEHSKTNSLGVDKIRYTNNGNTGYVDIHYSLSNENIVAIDFNIHVRPDTQPAFTANTLGRVADSPSGETVLSEYRFARNTDAVASPELGEYASTFESNSYVRIIDGIAYIRVGVTVREVPAGGWRSLFTIPPDFTPLVGLDFFVMDNTTDAAIHARVFINGSISIFPESVIPSGRLLNCYITYPIE